MYRESLEFRCFPTSTRYKSMGNWYRWVCFTKIHRLSITIKFSKDVVSGNVDKLYDFKKGGENGLTNPIN